jgi:hypothetical protein
MLRDSRFAYAFPILIRHMAVLESEIDLLFQICGKVVVAINHVRVASALFDEVGNLRWRHASPDHVRARKSRLGRGTTYQCL